MDKSLVIMFVKEPIKGFVKTRLSKSIGEEFTMELYKLFVSDLITTLQTNNYHFKLCAYPSLKLVNKTFGEFNNFVQVDGNLGVKMQKAFESQFELGYEKVILIGSDTPHISNSIFKETFTKLDTHDIVLGPSQDGGYYLIAFNKHSFYKEVFKNISWSTSEVLKQTQQTLNTKKLHLTQELNDIDDINDLNSFYNQYKNSYFKDSKTVNFLQKDLSWKSTT